MKKYLFDNKINKSCLQKENVALRSFFRALLIWRDFQTIKYFDLQFILYRLSKTFRKDAPPGRTDRPVGESD